MSTTTKLEVNLSKKYIEPEEGSEEWCKTHLDDARCEQYRPVDPTPGPQQDVPNTGHYTTSETGDSSSIVAQNQISTIFFGGFCVLLLLTFIVPKLINKINKNRKNYINLKKTPIFNKIRVTTLALAILSLGASIFSSVEAYVHFEDKEITASEKVTINAEILGTDEIAYVHDTVTVPATDYGFSLYATAELTDLVDIYNPAHTIQTITNAGQLANNTYGVYVGKEAPTSESVFFPIYTSAQQYNIFSTSATSEQTIDVWYGVRSKENTASTYTVNIELTALESHDYSMQEMTEEICAELEPGIMDYKFRDVRDDKIYTVGKYMDGNCWMTQNLDLDLSTERTLTPADSDVAENWTPSKNTNTEEDDEDWVYDSDCKSGDFSKCEQYSFDPKEAEDGNYYNIASATAGTIQMEDVVLEEETVSRMTSTASICPSNWHMATESEWMNMIKKYISLDDMKINEYLYGRDTKIVVDSTPYDLNEKIPSLRQSGIYVGTSEMAHDIFGGETKGVYKAIKTDGETDLIELFPMGLFYAKIQLEDKNIYGFEYAFNTVLLDEVMSEILTTGMPVRCVANHQNYSLMFDANINDSQIDSENLPETQFAAVTELNKESGVDFTIPSEVPTRSDNYKFLGWATSKEDAANKVVSYVAGATIHVVGMNTKLYAVWNDSLINPRPYVIRARDNESTGLTFLYTNTPYVIGERLYPEDETSPIIEEIYDIPNENDLCLDTLFVEYIIDGWAVPYYNSCVPKWAGTMFDYETIIITEEDFPNLKFYDYIHIDESFKEYKPTSTAFWFAYMANVTEFTGLEYLNTSNTETMAGMFKAFISASFFETGATDDEDEHCNSEENVCDVILDFSTFETEKVRDMTAMFSSSIGLGIEGIESFKTDSLESTYSMFEVYVAAGTNYQEIDFSGWNMKNNKYPARMFHTAISDAGFVIKGIENWDMSSAVDLSYMFSSTMIGVEGNILDLTGWNISNVISIKGMFQITQICQNNKSNKEYSALECGDATYDLSGWDTSSVVDMSYMFGGNNSVSDIIFGKKRTGETTIGWDVSNVKSITDMFTFSTVSKIYVDQDWYVSGGSLDGQRMFYWVTQGAAKLVGGSGTTYNKTNPGDWTYARIDDPEHGKPGYFTDACVFDDSCSVVETTPSLESSPQPVQSVASTSTNTQSYGSYNTQHTETSEPTTKSTESLEVTDKPTTKENKKSTTKKSDTKSEQTEPLGVEKSVEKASTVDTAVIAVIVASFVLVSAGAVIIFLIEKRRNEDEE